MFTTSKIKWFGTVIVAGILLLLAMLGGKWGTSYAADASINAAPYIDNIVPSAVPAGSPYIIMIISGGNFGTLADTRVRLKADEDGYDDLLLPLQVLPDGISVIISTDLLVVPKLYTVTVVKSTSGTVPTIPTIPPWDEVSNPVPFTVFEPTGIYLPIISK
jgi:hypothetical protein